MAAPPPSHPDPAFSIDDLEHPQQEAFEQGHDADARPDTRDTPSKPNLNTNTHGIDDKTTTTAFQTNLGTPTLAQEHDPERDADVEKGGSNVPSTAVSNGDGDGAEKAQRQEQSSGSGGAAQEDPNVVSWDGDDDPANPQNWTTSKKWTNMGLLSFVTFVIPLSSSMFAPGVPQILADFHNENTLLATFVVSVAILGFALGPLVMAPMSEMYGRAPLYHAGNIGFVTFTIACAVSNSMGMLIGFRFLAGCFGSACLTIGGGTVADLMPPEKRGRAMALWAMGPLLGPVVGPICGGFLVQAKGWRWVFWLLAIVSGFITISCLVFLRETNHAVLLARKATQLRKTTGNAHLRSKLDSGLARKELFLRAIVRPTKMLTRSPIVAIMSLYTAVTYGILYLLFTTFTFVFEDHYGFSSGHVGLTYIGIGVGMIAGLILVGRLSDRALRAHKARGRPLTPEMRLPVWLVLPPACCIPAGLFLYGWTAQYHVQWAVPLLGTMFFGFGLLACMMCIQTYLVDAFSAHAASAMAANTVLRSIFGALLPLAGLDMYDALGLGWGNSLLAFIALALVPIPVLFRLYGQRIRTSKRAQVNV